MDNQFMLDIRSSKHGESGAVVGRFNQILSSSFLAYFNM